MIQNVGHDVDGHDYVPLNIEALNKINIKIFICSKAQVEMASVVTYTDFKTTE